MSIARHIQVHQQAVSCLLNWSKAPAKKTSPLQFQLLATQHRRPSRFQSSLPKRKTETVSEENSTNLSQDEPSHSSTEVNETQQQESLPHRQAPLLQKQEAEPLADNLRQLMRCVPQSVVLVTSALNHDLTRKRSEDHYRGATLSSFTVVSLGGERPVISFNLKKSSSVRWAIMRSNNFHIHFPHHTAEAANLLNDFASGKGQCEIPDINAIPPSKDKYTVKRWHHHHYPIVGSQSENVIYGSIRCRYLRDKTVHVGDHAVMFGEVRESFLSEKMHPKTGGLAYLERQYWDLRTTSPIFLLQDSVNTTVPNHIKFGLRLQPSSEPTEPAETDDMLEATAEKDASGMPLTDDERCKDSVPKGTRPELSKAEETANTDLHSVERKSVEEDFHELARGHSGEESSDASQWGSLGDPSLQEDIYASVDYPSSDGKNSEPKREETMLWPNVTYKTFTSNFFAHTATSPPISGNGTRSADPGYNNQDINPQRGHPVIHPAETPDQSIGSFSAPYTAFQPSAGTNVRNVRSNFHIRKINFKEKLKYFFRLQSTDTTKLSDILAGARQTGQPQLAVDKVGDDQAQAHPDPDPEISQEADAAGLTGAPTPEPREDQPPASMDLELNAVLNRLAAQAREREVVKKRAERV